MESDANPQTMQQQSRKTRAETKWRLEVELAHGLNELLCAAQSLEKTVVEIQKHFRLRTFDDLVGDPDQIPF
jgi:hypothetical protein